MALQRDPRVSIGSFTGHCEQESLPIRARLQLLSDEIDRFPSTSNDKGLISWFEVRFIT